MMQTIILLFVLMAVCAVCGCIFGMIAEGKIKDRERVRAGELIIAEDLDGLHMMAALSMDLDELAINDEVYFSVSKPHKPSYGNIVSFKGKENRYE